MLESGKSPVLEAGMAEMVAEGIADAIRGSEVVIVATKEVDRDTVRQCLAPEQIVIDLVNCEKSHRSASPNLSYEGICW